MCVPNLASQRRPQAAPISADGVCRSLITQRLLNGLPTNASFPSSQPTKAYVTEPVQQKPRPKRRRKPQKPGKTAKNNDRHFVVHNYHDHANDTPDMCENDVAEVPATNDPNHRRRGGVAVAFPVKLHAVLDQVEADGLAHVISWQPHGRCFVIHKPTEFVDYVMPKYFRQTKLTSFQRQLNLYGFCRLTRGADAGGYYHELFLRGKPFLCKRMVRTKVKGTRFKAASSPDQEPNFYTLPPVVVTPPVTSDEETSYSSEQQHHDMTFYPVAAVSSTDPLLLATGQAPTAQPTAAAPFAFPVSHVPFEQQPVAAFSAEADRVLDEAVDELFLNETSFGGDSLAEFVQDWDPNNAFADSLQDDSQLGFMLEKLLED